MSQTVVGSEACSLATVIKMLKKTPTFSCFQKSLGDVAAELDVEMHVVDKFRRDIDIDKISLRDAVEKVIVEWISKTGTKATVTELIRALDESGLRGCADPLREKYLVTTTNLTAPVEIPSTALAKGPIAQTTSRVESMSSDCASKDEMKKEKASPPANVNDVILNKKNATFLTESIKKEEGSALTGQLPDTFMRQQTSLGRDGQRKKSDIYKYGSKDLFTAIRNKDVKLVMEIAKSISREIINEKDEEEFTALHLATWLLPADKQVEVIKCLIDNGCNVYKRDSGGWPFLPRMIRNAKISPAQFHDFAIYLANKGYAGLLNEKFGEFDDTVVQDAVVCFEIEERTLLVLHSHGVDFNAVNDNGANMLFYAVRFVNKIKLFSTLIRLGVNVNCVRKDGWTLLHYAAAFGKDEHVAEMTKLLLENGVSINAVTTEGWSALMLAVRRKRNVEYLKLLVECGVDWKIKTLYNFTILMNAANFGSVETLEYFLCLGGVSVNALTTTSLLGSALHYAVARKENEDVVKKVRLLLSHGADPTTRNNDGLTPLQLVVTKEHSIAILEELRKILN